MSQMFKDYRPGHVLVSVVAATPEPHDPSYDPRCCRVCWKYGKAIPLKSPCPACTDRAKEVKKR